LQSRANQKGEKMNTTKGSSSRTSRTNAVIVGILFIIGTMTGVAAAMLGSPILDAPDYLSKIVANEGTVVSGAFLIFVMGLACAGIGLGLYPILRQYNIGLAIGVVGFRLIEGMADVLGGLSYIALLALSREYMNAGALDAAYFHIIGAIIKASSEWINNGVVLISWCIGAFIYYDIFYRYQLVPRWISVWGLIGITLTTITSVMVMFGVASSFGAVQMIANLPILLQEMVMAVWLIAKGFNPSAIASEPAKTATIELLSAA
jgi:Domain of unknown function (DUF4386)